MDDRVASTTARLLGLEVRPAVYLLVYWTRKKVATAATALAMLDELVKRGYRLGADDYVTIKDLVAGGRVIPRRLQSPWDRYYGLAKEQRSGIALQIGAATGIARSDLSCETTSARPQLS